MQRTNSHDIQSEIAGSAGVEHRLEEGATRSIKPVKAHAIRRFSAFLVDLVGLMWIVESVKFVLSLIPGLSTTPLWHAVPAQLVVTILLLGRDYFFEGRGIGKNFFGMQVVDAMTGKPVTALQSVRRNAPLLAPFVVVGLTFLFTEHLPLSTSNEYIGMAVVVLSTIYLTIALPLETYRMLLRSDGTRVSDVWSKTTIVAAEPDFSNPLSRQRKR